jgi:uncharacterized phage-associated protein
MPAWSPEIANDFLQLSFASRVKVNQLQLQALIYIAHGWCLAVTAMPLTSDRPEASPFGPRYPKLQAALIHTGMDPITTLITCSSVYPRSSGFNPLSPARSELETIEVAVIGQVFHKYGAFDSEQLAAITMGDEAPWRAIYDDSRGMGKVIPDEQIRIQFVRFASTPS